MTSKEALERLGAEKLARGELIRNDSKVEPYIECINKDLERLEVLEKENIELKELQELNKQGLWNLKQENEKLKKALKILKDHVQFKLVPIVSNDPILEGAYHFGMKIDKYGYYATLPKIEAEVLKEVLGDERN